MPTPKEYEEYIQYNCPRLYGRQVMMWLFRPEFRKAVQEQNEEVIGKLLSQEIGITPTAEGFQACDEWEKHLGG